MPQMKKWTHLFGLWKRKVCSQNLDHCTVNSRVKLNAILTKCHYSSSFQKLQAPNHLFQCIFSGVRSMVLVE